MTIHYQDSDIIVSRQSQCEGGAYVLQRLHQPRCTARKTPGSIYCLACLRLAMQRVAMVRLD